MARCGEKEKVPPNGAFLLPAVHFYGNAVSQPSSERTPNALKLAAEDHCGVDNFGFTKDRL